MTLRCACGQLFHPIRAGSEITIACEDCAWFTWLRLRKRLEEEAS